MNKIQDSKHHLKVSTISKQRRETYTGAFFLQSNKLKYFQKSLEEQETSVQSRS